MVINQNRQQHHIVLSKVQPLLPDNPIVIEAGARFGKDTRKMSSLWHQGHIHAFEPVPALFEELKEKTQKRRNISCYNYALSNQIGRSPMFVSGGRSDACSSLLKPKECLTERPDITFEKKTTVQTITLDAWSEKYDIHHVDFMWLDLQGAELMALQGAKKLLKTIRVIHVEINTTERYEANPLADEIISFLQAQGFILKEKNLHHETWGDALFINTSI